MAEEVFMDIPQVEKMSSDFKAFGDVLDGVGKALQAISLFMKATAWISFGATEAVAQFIDQILPNVKRAGESMRILSQDITSAVHAYRDGDYSGSRHFC
jgi:hypothetical protein